MRQALATMMLEPVRDISRPEHVDAEPEEGQACGTGAAPAERATTARVLALQRTVGNRAVQQLLARRARPQTRLERLDELLGKFNVDEDAVIAHLATLDDAEKRVVLRDYRKRIASPLNACEMVRAVKALGPPLPTKLYWVATAGTPDYGDIRPLITESNVPQGERDALATNGWRDWFVRVCTNATMKQAVVDLGFNLPNQLAFIAGEMSADYDDIKSFITAKTVTDRDRERLKTDEWRKWFVGVCTNATMRDAVIDLRFDVPTKVDWMIAEGTDTKLLASALRASRRPELADLVADLKLLARIRSELGADGVATVDQVHVERAQGDEPAEFTKVVDLIPEPRLHNLAAYGSWLKKVAPILGDERFAYLAARIMLVSRYAPRARTEALRVLTAQLQDRETALRMIAEPVQVVIVPRDKMMTELAEFRSLLTSDSGGGPGRTFDKRQWAHVRGVGNVVVGGRTYAAITEENLLGGDPDPKTAAAPKDAKGKVVGTAGTPATGYTIGYSTTTHEFAHVLHRNGLSSAEKKLISKHYNAKRKATETKATLTLPNVWPDGPRISPTAPASWATAGWTDAKWIAKVAEMAEDSRKYYENYSAQNESEYFAQLSNAYLGTNLGSDPTTGQPRNNGRPWIVANEDGEMLALLDKVYKHRTVNEIEAGGGLKAGGLCTNPDPGPPPPPPGPPPKGGGP
jgi:hypothetical protein